MDRKKLKKIFFETDIFPWLPFLRIPFPRVGGLHRFYWKRAFLCRLRSCVKGGIDLPRSLEICLKERLPSRMRWALGKVKAEVEEGQPFSGALRRHAPGLFPKTFFGAIEIGEESGTLADILEMLDRQFEDMAFQRWTILKSIFYPTIVLIFCFSLISFSLTKVTPTFAEIYSDLGGTLPAATQAVANTNIIIVLLLWCLIPYALVSIFFFSFLARRVSLFNRLLLLIPFFGPLIYHGNMYMFSSLMSMLIRAGMPVSDALSLCEGDAVWPAFRKAIEETGRDVSEGKSFSEALTPRKAFSSTFLWLASVGERRGDLADSLSSIADFEREQIREKARLFSQIVQPVLILLMGLGIGFLIVAMWLPVLDMPFLLELQ